MVLIRGPTRLLEEIRYLDPRRFCWSILMKIWTCVPNFPTHFLRNSTSFYNGVVLDNLNFNQSIFIYTSQQLRAWFLLHSQSVLQNLESRNTNNESTSYEIILYIVLMFFNEPLRSLMNVYQKVFHIERKYLICGKNILLLLLLLLLFYLQLTEKKEMLF